jgi:hypothetical protein
LSGAFLEYPREFLSEIIHIIAELHNRNHPLYLIVYFVAAKVFEPLMMIVKKPWGWVLFTKLLPDITINSIIDKQHHILAPPKGARPRRTNGPINLNMSSAPWATVAQAMSALPPLLKHERTLSDIVEPTLLASRPEEFHLRALPEPYVNLSIHTAPDVRPLPWHSCQ